MGKRLKRLELWVRRRSYLPVLVVGALVVFLLYSSEETSVTRNMAAERQIRDLKKQIEVTRDSTAYYRLKHDAIVNGGGDLEKIAREQYRMKRRSEDIYIIKEDNPSE